MLGQTVAPSAQASSCSLGRFQTPRPIGNGRVFTSARPVCRSYKASRMITSMKSSIQFIKGINESSVPDVKLTRARDGSSGTATFVFSTPSVFEASSELGDITGLYLVDDEGELSTVDVQAKFVNGKPDRIEAKYLMRSAFEWDRFMRFMERYAEDNGLGFTKGDQQSA